MGANRLFKVRVTRNIWQKSHVIVMAEDEDDAERVALDGLDRMLDDEDWYNTPDVFDHNVNEVTEIDSE